MKGDPECPEARASPGRLSPSSRDRPTLHPGPKGGAEGAPDVPDKRGGSGRGGLPPLAMKGDSECPEARAAPGRVSPSSRDRPALHPGPKGGAEGAPNVPDKRGVLEGGACPHLHFSPQRPVNCGGRFSRKARWPSR